MGLESRCMIKDDQTGRHTRQRAGAATQFWNFPVAAVEEALGNAIYHRSYEEREPVEVRVTPEELLILSYPGADRSIRMGDLQRGEAVSRRYRNRRIGEFLKELDLAGPFDRCAEDAPRHARQRLSRAELRERRGPRRVSRPATGAHGVSADGRDCPRTAWGTRHPTG